MKEKNRLRRKRFIFFRELFKKKTVGGIGLAILVFFILVAIFADVLAPYPMQMGVMQADVLHSLQKPYIFMTAAEKQEAVMTATSLGGIHLLGTDSMGRDTLSYIIYGARTSVILCLCCMVLSAVVSVIIGTTSATVGGWFDLVVQRLVDSWLCIPSMLVLLMLMSMLGHGMLQMIFALSVPSGIAGSRIIRSATIAVKDSGYMKNCTLLGGGTWWKIVHHIIPNILPLIITNMAGSLGSVVLMEASISFLGFGVDPSTPSWGYLIAQEGKANMFIAPWLCITPGICISLMVFGANMFGDALRDLLDPRLKGGVGTFSIKKMKKLAQKQLKKMEKFRAKQAKGKVAGA